MLRLRLPSLGFTVLVLILAGLVWWSWPQRPLALPQIDWHGQIHKGDQAAEDVVMRQYDAAGKLDLLATAHTAYHEPHRDQTILSEVVVKRFRPGQELNLRADQGKVEGSTHLITLWGNVIGTLKPDTRFLTAKVHYDPQTGIISTQDAVRLEHGQDWMTGNGLWASVKTEEVNILQNVRGVYAP
ncbi:LPS export ABC transporter periplasmic protein LptC [Acidithiobacillus montserratensis]|uniref:LPS export ABC transporter periplasmic protein LptC n=1 Tax=Acidithiobacillus montserratensis TaxID=2729135 RepID=A0ACD5HHT8_9PROT|nr:LPS export ABC transporter periplasmic protein LptC [Acidithiobacillus montserratensis]MBN2679073.1 LPS export ABC transporter periplasmic protein LptC [Acidithiobacillaceae bacterium]MBU2747026.1 LPS export ABC transporter periplasmic protein LptC [Acidithiobacillus montserratensis]